MARVRGASRSALVSNARGAQGGQRAVDVPVVVRLEGTNVEKGKEILLESGLDFLVADGMRDAAEKVVAAAKGR